MRGRKSNWFLLFSANFLGIFNDNFLKYLLIFVAVTWNLPSWLSQSQLIAAISGALVLPYLILSPLAGKITVKYHKQKVFSIIKLLEIPVLLLAVAGFWCQNIVLGLLAVLFMGILSCLYSPAKYSLIKDIGGEEHLSFGSGMIEAMAFAGILLGTVTASWVSDHYAFAFMFSILILVGCLGYLAVRFLNVREATIDESLNSTSNLIRFINDTHRIIKPYPLLHQAMIYYAIFWLLGGVLQMNLVLHCKTALQCSNTVTGIVTAMAAIGIISGCLVAGKVISKTNHLKVAACGVSGIVAALLVVIFGHLSVISFAAAIFAIAFSGGFLQVPSLVLVQQNDLGRKIGDVMAYLNWLTFVYVLVGTVLFSIIAFLTNDNSIAIFIMLCVVAMLTLVSILYRQLTR
ncbi:MAG: MFS transporter [Bacteroidales bacterium]|jgi:acyl-[acyl-carrier-protein]-phospholipid O-acyltransferase/long-chain-fatty-acid--[acyl-carrier-protein] ligase|nr:MFS transporter [Bacteroidales bacterium]